MAETLHLSLLGKLQIILGQSEVTDSTSGKAQGLLCYLAVTRRAHSRAVLADLLWGEMPEEAARSNLRMALSTLRRQFEPYLTVTRDSLALNLEASLMVDVQKFEQVVTPILRRSGEAMSEVQVASLTEAIGLYRGDFLEGFYVRDAPAFEEWVLGQRERLRQLALQVLNWLALHHTKQGELGLATDYTAQLLNLEPWLEEAHRQMMLLLALRGQKGAALAQYDICRRLLDEELGVEPAPETTTLYEQIRRGEVGPPSTKPATRPQADPLPAHNLPAQLTTFVGREEELAQIGAFMGRPEYRLISIVGPGGMGKTRLAVQVATQQLGRYANGVYFVPLEGVVSSDQIVPAIANTLNFTFQGSDSLKTQLLNALRDKEMLLVLDNFEHLVEGASLVLDLLRNTQRIFVLITSRERLNLQAECVMRLDGLPCPEEDEDSGALTYGSVRLYVERATRASMSFKPTARNLQSIVKTCRLVEGRPLGIELAAAWIGDYSATQIASSIERNLDFLATTMHDLPTRHQSIRAVFEHSWKLLTPDERRILQALSCFRGGFDEQAALAVADASPTLLAALRRKSLLRESPSHRFHLHELVRQYAEEKLRETSGAWEEVHRRHAAFYASYLEEREPGLKGGRQTEVLNEIRAEIENVQAAWRWSVQHGQEVEKYLDSLYLFYDTRNWLQEGQETFALALASLGTVESETERARLRGRILARQGVFARRRGLFEQGRALLEESAEILSSIPDKREWAFALNNLGYVVYRQGEYAAARQLLEQSVALYRQVDDPWGEANALNVLGIVMDVYDYDAGQALFAESYQIRRAIGDRRGMALCLNNWGVSVEMQQKFEQATELYQESLALSRELGDRWILGMVLSNIGDVATTRADYRTAETYYTEALELANRIGAVPDVMLILIKMAAMRSQQGKSTQVLELLGATLAHPATLGETREQAEHHLAELATRTSENEIAMGLERGRTKGAEEIVASILSGTPTESARMPG